MTALGASPAAEGQTIQAAAASLQRVQASVRERLDEVTAEMWRVVATDDPMVAQYLSEATADKVEILCGISGAILVVAVGWYLVRSTRLREEEADV